MSLISSESSLLISDVQSIREKLAQIPSKYPLTPNKKDDDDELKDQILSTIKKEESNISCSMLREESFKESIQKYEEELVKSRQQNRNDSSLSAGIDEHYSVKDEDFEEYHEEPSENIAYRESLNMKVSRNHQSLEKSDSNISFATSKHSKKHISSNISEIENFQKKSNEIDNSVKKGSKPPSEEPSILSNKSKISQPIAIDNTVKPKENEKNLSNVKKTRPQTGLEKKIEKPNKNDPLKKNLISKPARPKSNHKKIVNEIMDNYKAQQNKIREKDDKIYVKETIEKIKPKPHLPPQKQEANKWNYDTNLNAEKEVLDRKKNEVKAQREKTKNKAEEFLKALEKKMKKETQVVNNKNNENDIFEEENVEKADEALPDLPERTFENQTLKVEDVENNENQEKQDENNDHQLTVKSLTNEDINENQEELKKNKNEKENNIGKTDLKPIPTTIQQKGKQKDEESVKEKEQGWTYTIGEGVQTEKNKTKKEDSKAQSKRSSSKIVELKKKENEKISKQKEELLNIEKEIQKKQKAYLDQQTAEQRQKKVEAPKEKEPKPLNLQYLAEKVERTEKEDQELKKLTKEFKNLMTENKELKATLKTTITRRQDLETQIVKKEKHPNIIVLPNGKITSFGLIPSVLNQLSVKQGEDSLSNVTHLSNNEGLNDASSLEKLVAKICSSGLTLQQLFQLIDFNGDQTITLSELEIRLPEIDLKLTNEEKKDLIAAVDKNNDGLINEQEFVFSLENPLKFEKEYWKIMGDIKIDHPQILEERILDLKFRKPQTLKELAAFEEKNNKNTQETLRLANKLKELEQTFSKRKKKDSTAESTLIRKRDQLILEVQNLEEELDKDKRNCEERQKEANSLIENLKTEFINLAENVLKKKQNLSARIIEYQKLQIKEMAYSKMETKIISLKEEKEKMENEKREKMEKIKERVRAQNIEKISTFIQAQLQTSCATKIQKLIRGKLDRLKTMRSKEEQIKSKNVIVKNFRNMKFKQKAKKNRNFCIFLKFLIDSQKKFGFRQLRKNYEDLNKGNAFFEEEEIKHADQSVPIPFSNERNVDLELFEDQVVDTGDQLLPNADRKSIKEKSRSPEKSDVLNDSNSFVAASIIQNKFRQKWGKIRKSVGFSLHHLPESEYCLLCKGKYRENKPIEIICLKCKNSLFCASCFELTHNNSLMNNHKFIDIQEEKQFIDEAEKISGQIAANLDLKKLEANLNSEDKAKNGLTTYAKVSEILRKMLDVEHHDLLKNFSLILNKCSLNPDMTYLRFKGKNEYFYDKREKYVDIGVLLSFLSIQPNE